MRAVSVFVHGDRAARFGYSHEWVRRLHSALERHTEVEGHVCLTDDPGGLPSWIQPVDIGRWWRETGLARGWWAKLKMFDQDLFEPGERLLYSDLDNLILGDLSPLAEEARGHLFSAAPMTAPNFRPRDLSLGRRFSSALMIWSHGFAEAAFRLWRPQDAARLHGDQDWLAETVPDVHVLDRRRFARGTRLLRKGPRARENVLVAFCTRAKNDRFVEQAEWAREHWT